MFMATLLCNPAKPVLEAKQVESVRKAWGGGKANWLAPKVAVEFELPEDPTNRWEVWGALQDMGVDLVVQPREGRRKKMLLADMDSTMIEQECIDELADEIGIGPQVSEITALAMNGELDFETALLQRVELLKGLEVTVIESVLTNRITFRVGAKTLLATMKANGAYTVLVSGGFTAFTAQIEQQLGFDETHANTLLIEEGKLTGEVEKPIMGADGKVAALIEITAGMALGADQVMAVGDGANDLGMLELVGAGVALHAKPVVAAQCDIRINHGDLTALLYIQGYGLDEFV